MKENLENDNFEEAWKKAFEEAEAKPSSMLWTKINQTLQEDKAAKKRKIYLFTVRSIAAACVLLLGIFFGNEYLNYPKTNKKIAENKNAINNKKEIASLNTQKDANQSVKKDFPSPIKANSAINEEQSISDEITKEQNKNVFSFEEGIAINQKSNRNNSSKINNKNFINKEKASNSIEAKQKFENQSGVYQGSYLSFNSLKIRNIPFQAASVNLRKPILNYPFSLIELEKMLLAGGNKKEEKKKNYKRWQAEVGGGTALFNPNLMFQNTNPAITSGSSSNSQPSNLYDAQSVAGVELEDKLKPALSYQTGVGIGFSLTRKITIRSGFQYAYLNSQITTNQYVFNQYDNLRYPNFVSLIGQSSVPEVIVQDFSNKSFTQQITPLSAAPYNRNLLNLPVNIYNTYHYLNIPLLVQYQMLDRKVGLFVITGASADFFLKNQVANAEANVKTYTFKPSDEQIYKKLAFSGIVALRANYPVFKGFAIFAEPQFRFALQSYSKSTTIWQYPSSLAITMGLQMKF
jgi:opacity protein-like surface antigen